MVDRHLFGALERRLALRLLLLALANPLQPGPGSPPLGGGRGELVADAAGIADDAGGARAVAAALRSIAVDLDELRRVRAPGSGSGPEVERRDGEHEHVR